MSNVNLAVRLRVETARTLAFGSISGTYMGIGTQLSNPASAIIIQNFTDVMLIYSFDGINDHIYLPASGQLILDVTTNGGQEGLWLAQGDRLYVKQESSGPSSGLAVFSVFYASSS